MIKKKRVYAFIDAPNLNLGVSKDIYKIKNGVEKRIYTGWKLDYKEFANYLMVNFHVSHIIMFIGYTESNRKLYDYLYSCNYSLIFKKIIKNADGRVKGNIDADLIVYVLTHLREFDKAIIVSGDGDFYPLIKYLKENNKLGNILIPNSKSQSSLLKEFRRYVVYLGDKRNTLELIKKVEGVRSVPHR